MDTIDLDKIHDDIMGSSGWVTFPIRVKRMMKEAIHQALVLASENARTETIPTSDGYEYWDVTGVDKQSILDVEKLIK